MEDALSR
jgi:hypothetical protein